MIHMTQTFQFLSLVLSKEKQKDIPFKLEDLKSLLGLIIMEICILFHRVIRLMWKKKALFNFHYTLVIFKSLSLHKQVQPLYNSVLRRTGSFCFPARDLIFFKMIPMIPSVWKILLNC